MQERSELRTNHDHMNTNTQQLGKMIEDSFKLQKVIFYGMAVFTALAGVVLIIMFNTLPVKPGEEQIVIWLKITAGVFLVFSGWCVWYVKRRIQTIRTLLRQGSNAISYVKPYRVSRRGVVAFAVRIYPKTGRMVGLNVIGPKTQEHMISLFEAQGVPVRRN